MKTINVNVAELLEHVKANRKKHIQEYAEAMETYRELVIKTLEAQLERAKQELDVEHVLDIKRPKSYLSAYNDVITMLEWTTVPEVNLDQNEFRQYVKDEWNWSGFGATASCIKV